MLWVGAKQFPEPFQIVYNEPPEPWTSHLGYNIFLNHIDVETKMFCIQFFICSSTLLFVKLLHIPFGDLSSVFIVEYAHIAVQTPKSVI